jgi:hypothetical protein
MIEELRARLFLERNDVGRGIFHVEGDDVLPNDVRGRAAGWHQVATLGGGVIAGGRILWTRIAR